MNKRLIYLDRLRLIAIVSVIIMHSTGAVQRYYSNGVDSVFLILNIPNAITRFSVPLFVMISGCLMINRGHDYKYLLGKAAHYMAIYFFWSIVYSLILIEKPFTYANSLKSLLVNTFVDSITGWFHFWFLFMICGLYLLLPIIEIIANNLSGNLKRYYIVLCIVCCFILKPLMSFPALGEILGGHLDSFLVGFLSLYSFYYLLGYWLKNNTYSNKSTLWAGVIAGLTLNAAVGNYSSRFFSDRMVSFIDAQSPVTLLVCVCLFLVIKGMREPEEKRKKLIVSLSELSFGVYLCHMLIIETIKPFFPLIENPFTACLITITLTLLLGFGGSWLLWHNRYTRKLIK